MRKALYKIYISIAERSQPRVPSCRTDHCVLLLPGEERELRLNEENFERAAALLRRVPEFTIAAVLRQEEANSGTIVAFSHGNNRYEIPKSSSHPLSLHFAVPFGNFGLDGWNKRRTISNTNNCVDISRMEEKDLLNIFL